MSVVFNRGYQLGREDLNIYIENAAGLPTNPAEIYYALYDFTAAMEALVGPPQRVPANPSVGEYYANIVIPLDANIGNYRIRWTFRETVNGPLQQAVQEFAVVDRGVEAVLPFSQMTVDMMRRLRVLLRDQNPARNYSFRPPSHEKTIRQYNQVFGFIWEDDELVEYLERGLDMVIAAPPRTPFSSVDQMSAHRPEWRTLLLTGAMYFALNALRINWVAEEFSVAPKTVVTVGLPDGRRIFVTMEELFGIVNSDGVAWKAIYEAFLLRELTVQAVCASGEVGWFPIKEVLRHNVPDKKAVRVTLDDGRFVESTEDHSLFVGLNPTRADKLEAGMRLTTVRDGLVSYGTVVSVDVCPSDGVMYDLSVPGPQNFVLTNGILAHNSYSIGGVSLDLDKASKYESAAQSASDQFDKLLERAKLTVKVTRGLQQPKYGAGIRSAFGPFVGKGILSPAKFMGM
jgi:hypothetical protein